mgnify:CR=1 FL=1
MSNFKYIQKDNKVYMVLGNNRMKIRWLKRWIPKADTLTILPSSVTLNKNSLTLSVGDTETLVATISPENTTDKDVIWTSSDDTVATVEDGLVTAISEGSATITAKCQADEEIDDECVVTIEETQEETEQ